MTSETARSWGLWRRKSDEFAEQAKRLRKENEALRAENLELLAIREGLRAAQGAVFQQFNEELAKLNTTLYHQATEARETIRAIGECDKDELKAEANRKHGRLIHTAIAMTTAVQWGRACGIEQANKLIDELRARRSGYPPPRP